MTDRSVLGTFTSDSVPDIRFNPAPSPSSSALISVSHAPLRPQSGSESRSCRKGTMGSTCVSRVVWSHRVASRQAYSERSHRDVRVVGVDDKGAPHSISCVTSLLTATIRSSSHQELLRHSPYGMPCIELQSRLRTGEQSKAGANTRTSFPSRIPIPDDIRFLFSSFTFSK